MGIRSDLGALRRIASHRGSMWRRGKSTPSTARQTGQGRAGQGRAVRGHSAGRCGGARCDRVEIQQQWTVTGVPRGGLFWFCFLLRCRHILALASSRRAALRCAARTQSNPAPYRTAPRGCREQNSPVLYCTVLHSTRLSLGRWPLRSALLTTRFVPPSHNLPCSVPPSATAMTRCDLRIP